ncbi:GRB10-interacting GYF protein 2-like [Watersipora subatra]|uniref:GRB10-interacting GYF protein 2-like n=1 Tax=Watersipora subatra TaxID=2589382 RepID=UPI00355C3F50
MAATLKFGPEWLRQLSSGGSMTSPPQSPSFGGKYKLADNRYGREEMLALFTPNPKAPDDLRQFANILVERCQDPMAMIAPTEEEQHLLASNVNSTVALRQVGRGGTNERGPPGMRGTSRGSISNRGRGRGRGESGFYQRGGFDDPGLGRGEGGRGRGREGGSTKVIERDSSGFLSARSYDESTDRRSKDPYSRSTGSSDRWSELRSARAEPGGRQSNPLQDSQPYDSSRTNDGEEKDDDWRRAGKDRQPRGNWRDAKPSFDDDSSRFTQNKGYGRQISFERSRSRQQEDELPEWATDDMGAGDEGGTFDSSGAFLSNKEADGDKSVQNGEITKRDRKQEIDKAKKSLPPLKISKEKPSNSARESPAITEESVPPLPITQISTTAANTDSKSMSTNTPSNHSTPRKDDLSSVSQSDSNGQKPGITEVQEKPQESVEPEADFEHLTEAAEQMMATWAAEDDEHPPGQEPTFPPVADPNTIAHANDWFYKDPQGTLQGPFKAQEMLEWYGAGYFTMSLLVKKGSDRDFQPLGELLKRGNAQPFVPSTPNVILPNAIPADPAIVSAHSVPDPRLQQQVFLIQQQQLLLQQQHQLTLLRQQQQLQQLAERMGASEEFANYSSQELQQMALQLMLKEQKHQGLLLPQAPVTPATHGAIPGHPQTSPPQQSVLPGVKLLSGPASAPALASDDDNLWGAAWSQQMREKKAIDEIAQKEASRQQEQQRLEAEREAARQLEQKRIEKQRELIEHQRQRMLDVERQRKVMEEQRRIQEEQRLLQEQMLLQEQRRVQEEKAKAEIRLQRDEMERQQRELDEKKRKEIERQDLEKKKQKEKQLEIERQREVERQKQLERERQQEVERKIEMEAARKAELKRKKEEEERLQAEAMEAEAARRAEQQRFEQEKADRELARQQAEKERERERLEALQLPSTAQWASSPSSNMTVAFDRQQSLQEIQRKEKEQAVKDQAAKAAAEKQRQLEQQELNSQQTQLKWASNNKPLMNSGKSLRQIQEEEALRLEKERKEQLKAAPVTNSSSSWAGKSVPTGWASEGAWGNAVRKGTWEQPSTKPVKASNSEVFPSLAVSSKASQSTANAQQKKKQTYSAQSAKKNAQNDCVQKIFQGNTNSDDRFTDWCKKSLKGLECPLDVETFIGFLVEQENPNEVKDYISEYLGQTPKSAQFAKDFLERRSQDRKQKKQAERLDDEESLWGPAPAMNPFAQRSSAPEMTNTTLEKKKKTAKKTKGQKTDASSLLGFTVGASSHRLNIGEIEKAE